MACAWRMGDKGACRWALIALERLKEAGKPDEELDHHPLGFELYRGSDRCCWALQLSSRSSLSTVYATTYRASLLQDANVTPARLVVVPGLIAESD